MGESFVPAVPLRNRFGCVATIDGGRLSSQYLIEGFETGRIGLWIRIPVLSITAWLRIQTLAPRLRFSRLMECGMILGIRNYLEPRLF